jgi:uncharacterized small protein (DUF1192 family)
MNISIHSSALATALLLTFSAAAQAAPFTYHGHLSDGGQPANGRYDLQVTLYGSEQSAAPLLPAVALFGVDVHDGSFSTEIDLGAAAQSGGWIGVAVRQAGASEFAALSGRQKLEPAGTCPTAWSLNGNTGITDTNFLGTLDAHDVVFWAGNALAGKFQAPPNGPSFVAGTGHANAVNAVSLNFGFADAQNSIAAGWGGVVRPTDHDSFVWGDHTGGNFETSGASQFLLRAGGGVGINTNSISGSDDLVLYPRSGGDADSDLAFTTPAGKFGRIYVSNASGTMFISGVGGVHITNPVAVDGQVDAKALNIQGNATKSTAGAWAANSDARIKQDIEPIADALDTLQKIHPVTFRYTDAYRADHASVTDQRYYNVIAQQFAQVFPDAVTGSNEYLAGADKTPDNEILQVDTYPAQIVTIAAVQELAQKNATLQATVERLSARLAKLEAVRGK